MTQPRNAQEHAQNEDSCEFIIMFSCNPCKLYGFVCAQKCAEMRFRVKNLWQFICKDTGSRNESAKLIIVTRLLILVMVLYSIVHIAFGLLTQDADATLFAAVSLVLFSIVLVVSYHFATFTTFCCLNLLILGWIITTVIYFGWNIGVQHFLITLLIFCFFSRYGHESLKLLYVCFLFAVRISLYYYTQHHAPLLVMDHAASHVMQVVNTTAIFISITLIVLIFSHDSQMLEGKLIEYNEQLMKQANTDTLTGLSNRRSTTAYLSDLLRNPETPISICLCDIDLFKRVNDTYGHEMGDVVLKRVASLFRTHLPSDCFVSRWGGEEFLLIFPTQNGDDARIALTTLSKEIKSCVFRCEEQSFSISMTFGLVEYDYVSDLDTLIKEADDKLYYGKEHGRDQIVY